MGSAAVDGLLRRLGMWRMMSLVLYGTRTRGGHKSQNRLTARDAAAIVETSSRTDRRRAKSVSNFGHPGYSLRASFNVL
eukprot:scaffold640062_cov43-Prasinocladus_malaysianus.AAC.1